MKFKYIIISIILISNLSWAASSKLQKVFIKGKLTSIPLMEINHKDYIKADDFAQLISIPINNNLDYLSFKNKSTQILFFSNSLIVKFSQNEINYLVQLHLPVIYTHNTYFLPFPSVFTSLDSLNFFEFSQISTQSNPIKQEKPKHTVLTQPDETEFENDKQINEVFNKIASSKVEEKHKETQDSDNSPHNQPIISHINKDKPAHNNTIAHHKESVINTEEINTFPNNEKKTNINNNEVIHLTPDVSIPNFDDKVSNNDKIITKIDEETSDESLFQNIQKVDEFGGYKIPKSIKRKKLDELKKYYENK